jgi:uncharacterized protein YodC (DUF2158 family)
MSAIKSGDLVVLKSGGPTMTVDTVTTDIFDDNKITGLFCIWFVGEKLERMRFDHGAVEPARPQNAAPRKDERSLEETTVDYKVVLDEMVIAMNSPAEDRAATSAAVPKQPKPKATPKRKAYGVRSSRRAVRDCKEPLSVPTGEKPV